jgi:hypothetical protein
MFGLSSIAEFIRGLRRYNYTPPKNNSRATPRLKNAEAPLEIPGNATTWNGIVWHHSATKDSPIGNDWASIEHYHTSHRVDGRIVSKSEYEMAAALGGHRCEKPWSAIGYHGGIEREGGRLVVRMGRPWNRPGAHAGLKGNNTYNELYLGFCLVGNYDAVAPDPETWELCLKVSRQLMSHFGFSKEHVIGHREVYDKVGVPRQKTCPGTSLNLELLRSML